MLIARQIQITRTNCDVFLPCVSLTKFSIDVSSKRGTVTASNSMTLNEEIVKVRAVLSGDRGYTFG